MYPISVSPTDVARLMSDRGLHVETPVDISMIKYLLDRNAYIDTFDRNGHTPLYTAIRL